MVASCYRPSPLLVPVLTQKLHKTRIHGLPCERKLEPASWHHKPEPLMPGADHSYTTTYQRIVAEKNRLQAPWWALRSR